MIHILAVPFQSNLDKMTDGQVDQNKILQDYNNWNQANYRKVGDSQNDDCYLD